MTRPPRFLIELFRRCFASRGDEAGRVLRQPLTLEELGKDPPAWAADFVGLPRLEACTALLRIRDRRGRLHWMTPNAAQRRYARRRSARNIILKARQVGMTTYVAARYFLRTLSSPGTVTLQVAHTREAAERIFRIVQRFARHLAPELFLLGPPRISRGEVSFPSADSRYLVDTAGNRNAGRGLTLHHLHASEAAQWPSAGTSGPAEIIAGLLAAVAPGGEVDIESTPRGAGGWFHGEWLRAAEAAGGAGGFTPHFFPWWVEPEYALPLLPGERLEPLGEDERLLIARHSLSLEQIKYRRRLRARFGVLAAQEYAEDDGECFLLSGQPVFETAALEARRRQLPAALSLAASGAEMVWYSPLPGRRYILGADVAEGTAAPGGDYSAAVVVDAETGLQCAELLCRWPVARFAGELARLGQRYNQALVAVERNNHGHAVLYALQHTFAYPQVYRHREDRAPGWPMNIRTKPQAIQTLARVIAEAPELISSARLLGQCRAFCYGRGAEMGALPGAHDDLVIAAAIAWTVRELPG